MSLECQLGRLVYAVRRERKMDITNFLSDSGAHVVIGIVIPS